MTQPIPPVAASLWLASAPLILASASPIRASLLRNLGIPLRIIPARIDERAISTPDSAHLAARLAQAKAQEVAAREPGQIVLGTDQTLICGGTLFHKPRNRDEARQQLESLSNTAHRLTSAACLMRDDTCLAQIEDSATIHMRALSPDLITRYLDRMGEAALTSVGAYQLEGLGPHLMDHIEGDHATILGLPLWPLLKTLRDLQCLL